MTMFMLVARAPQPDAPYWPGRHLMALVDAVVWPMLVGAIVANVPYAAGIAGRFALALCVVCAVRRATRALWSNTRYRFTTVRLGMPLATLIAVGAFLKIVA